MRTNSYTVLEDKKCLFNVDGDIKTEVSYEIITKKTGNIIRKGLVIDQEMILPINYINIVMLPILRTYPTKLYFAVTFLENNQLQEKIIAYNTLSCSLEEVNHDIYSQTKAITGDDHNFILVGQDQEGKTDVFRKKDMSVEASALAGIYYLESSQMFVGYRFVTNDSFEFVIFDKNGNLVMDDHQSYQQDFLTHRLVIDNMVISLIILKTPSDKLKPIIPSLCSKNVDDLTLFSEFFVNKDGYITYRYDEEDAMKGLLKIRVNKDHQESISLVSVLPDEYNSIQIMDDIAQAIVSLTNKNNGITVYGVKDLKTSGYLISPVYDHITFKRNKKGEIFYIATSNDKSGCTKWLFNKNGKLIDSKQQTSTGIQYKLQPTS